MPATLKALQVAIRCATPADIAVLASLRYALRANTGIATEPETDFLRRCGAWMEERLKAGDAWQCWVAEENGELVGAVWLQLIEKIPNPRSEAEHHAYLTNFCVQESARGKGIGSSLLAAALEWCQTSDVNAVILWPTDRSRSLYARHGFAVCEDIMELKIDASG